VGAIGAGIWSAPTLDLKRGRLYVTTGDNYSPPATNISDAVLALDMKNGRIVWAKQTVPGDVFNGRCQPKGECPGPDYDFGASAILDTVGNRDFVLVGQKSGIVYALDPDKKGEIVWQARVGNGGVNGGVQWGMASDGRLLYAATSDVVRRAGAPYDPKEGGGLTALRIASGAKAWYAAPPPCREKQGCSPAQSAAVTAIPGVVFAGSLDGTCAATRRKTEKSSGISTPLAFSQLLTESKRAGEGSMVPARLSPTAWYSSHRATHAPAAWAATSCSHSGRSSRDRG
jgi:polyvinyl alcohol dehydrogenase (cytochrome)